MSLSDVLRPLTLLRQGLGAGTGPRRPVLPPVTLRGRTGAGGLRAVWRRGGRDLLPDREALDLAHPLATGDLVVLVPGTTEDEELWGAGRHLPSYAVQLARLLDWTPLHLCVTGGPPAALAPVVSGLLQATVEAWPVPVRRLLLVGHADGGLVLRAAAGVRQSAPTPWTDLVSDLVVLGTPHLAVPPRRPARRLSEQASAGIVTSDHADPDLVFLPHARHVVVTARRGGAGPSGGLPGLPASLFGDLRWWRRVPGLRPRRARHLFPGASHYEVDVTHAPLSQHPEVASALLEWCAPRPV